MVGTDSGRSYCGLDGRTRVGTESWWGRSEIGVRSGRDRGMVGVRSAWSAWSGRSRPRSPCAVGMAPTSRDGRGTVGFRSAKSAWHQWQVGVRSGGSGCTRDAVGSHRRLPTLCRPLRLQHDHNTTPVRPSRPHPDLSTLWADLLLPLSITPDRPDCFEHFKTVGAGSRPWRPRADLSRPPSRLHPDLTTTTPTVRGPHKFFMVATVATGSWLCVRGALLVELMVLSVSPSVVAQKLIP